MSPQSARTVGVFALIVATSAMVAAVPARLRETHHEGRRVIAIVVDDLHMTVDDFAATETRFATVRAALRDADVVAIASTGYSSVATDAMGNDGKLSKRLDQAIDKMRDSVQKRGSPGYMPRIVNPLYDTFVGLMTASDVLDKISLDQNDQKTLVWIGGTDGFDAFEAIRHLLMARRPLPPAAGWKTAPDDLSANIVTGQLETLLQTAERNRVTFLTMDANGYAAWRGDGSATRVAGID